MPRRCLLLLPLFAAACSGESGAPADLVVVSVRDLGTLPRPASIEGRDGGVSGRFMGRSVWVYGDTVAKQAGTFPTTWRNNTMSWTDDADASDGIDGFVQPADALGAAREFFPRTAEEEAFDAAHADRGDGTCAAPCGARYAIWGGGPLEAPARGRALLTYGKVYAEPGEFNFTIVGTSVAVWENFEAGPTRPPVTSDVDGSKLLFDGETEGEFGIPALADDRLYLFSCSGGPDGSRRCRLARAPLDDLFRRASWQFRTAAGWSANVADAVALFEGSPNMTVHWSAHLGRWLAVYMADGVVARTAPALEGPWSRPVTLFRPREDGANMALAHAEYQQGNGATEYVSYLAGEFKLLQVQLAPP